MKTRMRFSAWARLLRASLHHTTSQVARKQLFCTLQRTPKRWRARQKVRNLAQGRAWAKVCCLATEIQEREIVFLLFCWEPCANMRHGWNTPERWIGQCHEAWSGRCHANFRRFRKITWSTSLNVCVVDVTQRWCTWNLRMCACWMSLKDGVIDITQRWCGKCLYTMVRSTSFNMCVVEGTGRWCSECLWTIALWMPPCRRYLEISFKENMMDISQREGFDVFARSCGRCLSEIIVDIFQR